MQHVTKLIDVSHARHLGFPEFSYIQGQDGTYRCLVQLLGNRRCYGESARTKLDAKYSAARTMLQMLRQERI